jgi:hypothetical protein
LLDLDLGRPRKLPHHLGDLLRGRRHGVRVVAKHLHGDIATHARDQLVEAQLDRLGEFVVIAGDAAGSLGNRVHQLRMRLARSRPLVLRAQDDVAVGGVGRHRVGCHLGGADAGKHALDLRKLL